MQLFAFTEKKQLIHAESAFKGCDYHCLECNGIVRKRGGVEVRDHFWHFKSKPNCSLSNKTMVHLQLQWYLQKIIPNGEALVECRFGKINRIADVAWPEKRLIFEVQYSPMTREEMSQRVDDYRSVGYEVIWILHTNTYNRKRLKAVEMYLETHPHYFTDFDDEGRGLIWDQIDLRASGIRHRILEQTPVLLTKPLRNVEKTTTRKEWKRHFEGDLLDQINKGKIIPPLLEIKKKRKVTVKKVIKALFDLWADYLYQKHA